MIGSSDDNGADGSENGQNQNYSWYYAPINLLTQGKEAVSNFERDATEKLKQYRTIFDPLAAILKQLPPYLKLYITNFQITATFLNFAVKWPSLLQNMMLWLKSTVFLDILSLPGLNCLWQGVNFKNKLLLYTLIPLGGVAILLLPVGYYGIVGYFRPRTVNLKHKKMAAVSAAWKNIMYLSFLAYPVVSLTTLQAFDCQPLGLNRLAADYGEPCPNNSNLLRVWSIIFIWIYPLGIPAFCYIAMLGMGVHLIAQDTLNKELLHGLAVKYIQCTGRSSKKVLELFNFGKDLHDTDVHSKLIEEIYNFFIDINGNIIENNRKFGSSDVDTEMLREFLYQHALPFQHTFSQDDFKRMLRSASANKNLMLNVTAGSITKEQAIELISFDWRKKSEHSLSESSAALANSKNKPVAESLKSLEKTELDKQAEDSARNKRKYLNYIAKNDFKILGTQLLKLAQDLRDENIITARTVPWDESINELENNENKKMPAGQHELTDNRFLQDVYALHPELPDDHHWNAVVILQNCLGNLFFKVPESWKCAQGRMKLKSLAINRVGFIFASYHAKFWFWELLEMLRKYVTDCLSLVTTLKY